MMFISKLAERLREERLKKELTQKELGDLLGITDAAVGMWENGRRTPDVDVLGTLAELFDCSVDYLIGRSEVRKPTHDDPHTIEILNRASNLTSEGWEQFRKAVDWVFEVDKDRKEMEKLRKSAKKDLGN